MIDLPSYPGPQSAEAGLIRFGADLTPSLGGPVQRVVRMGSRFRLSVQMPPMGGDKLGRQWNSALIKGQTQGVRMEFPLQGFEPGAPGNVAVNGAGQAGTTLNVKTATPNYAFREGQFFSIETGGQHFLYMVAVAAVANGTGNASLTIEPPLRRAPSDGDLCHFGKPMIEGYISGDDYAWQMSIDNLLGLSFDVVERE